MAPPGRRYLALRTGVTAAAAVTSNTFARGLLPRTTTDQAMATGVTAALGLGIGTLAVSAVEATAELVATSRGRGDPENTTLIAAAIVAGAGYAGARFLPNTSTTPLAVAAGNSAARLLGGGAAAAALVIASDKATRRLIGPASPAIGMATAAAIGGTISAIRVNARDRHALAVGETGDRRQIQRPQTAVGVARSAALGGSVGAGLMVLAGAEYALAEGSTALVSRALGRREHKVTPLVGHSIAAALMVPAGFAALDRLRRRLMHADGVVEAAYPAPPTSRSVTAGPASLLAFEDIGKEGRRFVLMALTADEIAEVMGEPADNPIRAVAGFESARTPETRADLALSELDALGAYEKSAIVVAAPTGVGYVNYSFAEALEYLTRGDCAIVVPQYALVPSALALNQTGAGIRMQTLILEGIRDRIAAMPEDRRPRLLQFGESLGAQVALDVAAEGTTSFDAMGLERGLYLGTPFRTRLWDRWSADPSAVDPGKLLGTVSQADEIPSLAPSVRHVQVIHHDDPINKFSYDAVVRAPWWMGPPETRPPKVPRETTFRPITTFVITLVDLKNGMNSKPGEFVRLGHDYRIELCDAIRHTYQLPASPEQVERIEAVLRERERDWATRRMVADRFASARASVLGQLQKWGVDPRTVSIDDESTSRLARGDLSGFMGRLGSPGSTS
ncbi:MAG TPA: alpha/beta-hydrolase family protein [Motilibacterales bacterium]|nr:alpha/beta-hydrolase family protein [Motilibacterales bacterium]